MKILLLGYGKMGKTIEQIASERGHDIVGRIDNPDQPKDAFNAENTDVAIEFSQPDSAVENIRWCLENQIPVVCGTTGWLQQWEDIVSLCRSSNGTFFYASNYSLGVNIFFRLNRYLAGIMDKFPAYDVRMEETHHTEKKDSPSGTAITIANEIVSRLSRKTGWEESHEPSEELIGIMARREEGVPGTHTVIYNSDEDSIELRHTAHSRKGFALGAVLVAEWIPGRKGPLGMDDFLNF